MGKDITYDRYYQTPDLFGAPYPILIDFFKKHPHKGRVLDLGCGQGRDAIAIARLGYEVVGIDHSQVGIDQMNAIAKEEQLTLVGKVADMSTYDQYDRFDIILLDSMFHFAKKDKDKEVQFLKHVLNSLKAKSLVVICIQDTGKKVDTLLNTLVSVSRIHISRDDDFQYTYIDPTSDHRSTSDYRMIVVSVGST